jgi:hypothetical protein
VILRQGHTQHVTFLWSREQYVAQIGTFNAAVLDGSNYPVTLEFSLLRRHAGPDPRRGD